MGFLARLSLVCLAVFLFEPVIAAETRVWVDKSGKHKIEAEFLTVEDGKVKLRQRDGKKVSISIDRLSESDQQFIQAQEDSSDATTLLDSVVRIVAPIQTTSKKPTEAQFVGCVIQAKDHPYPIVIASRSSQRKVFRMTDLDVGLAKAEILDLLSPKQLGRSTRLGFPFPINNRLEGFHDLLIVLKLKEGSRVKALQLAEKGPKKGDIVRIPLLPQPRRVNSKSRRSTKIEWTSWKVFFVDSHRMYVEPENGKFPYSGTLPILNSKNEVVGLYAVKVVLADKRKVGDGLPLSVIQRALTKASFNALSEAMPVEKLDTSHLTPIPTTPVDENANWRKSYESLASAIQARKSKEAVWGYNWEAASDFGIWYERCRLYSKNGDRIMKLPPAERAAALNASKDLSEEIDRAAERLKGIEWTATVKTISYSPEGLWRFEIPKSPEPISFWFRTEKENFSAWSDVKKGDRVRFACRFSANTYGDDPLVFVYMTFVEKSPE